MDASERSSLAAIVSEEVKLALKPLANSIEEMRQTANEREARLANEFNQIRQQVQRALDTANAAKQVADAKSHEASAVFESMKMHSASVDSRMRQFEKMIGDLANESHVQTATLAELASATEERARRSQETQDLVKSLAASVATLLTAETERQKREAVQEALAKEERERVDTFWKRLPIRLSIAVVAGSIVLWFLNAFLTQNRVINNLPVKGGHVEQHQ